MASDQRFPAEVDMKEKKQKSMWLEIGSRSGRRILPDGERTRPCYLGAVVNLETGVEEVISKASVAVQKRGATALR